MKRFLFCLVLSMIFITPMYSQIQNRFFGYLFGSRMYHMVDAMENKVCFQEEDKLNVKDVRFGGVKWDYAEIQYFKDQFCAISFTIISDSKKIVSESFTSLKSRLDDKYSLYKLTDDDNSQQVAYTDFDNFCMLEYKYSESRGGNMHWYLNLTYWNIELIGKGVDSENSEL